MGVLEAPQLTLPEECPESIKLRKSLEKMVSLEIKPESQAQLIIHTFDKSWENTT